MNPVVVCAAKRTPIGAFQGSLSNFSAPQLGTAAIRSLSKTAFFDPGRVEEVAFGCVLSAGLGQAPARQAAIGAGLPEHVPATTINKMCGSGMKSVMIAHDRLSLRGKGVAVAGGMESMTNAPYLIPKLRPGARLGHAEAKDHMFLDGLEDAYQSGRLMGVFAEDCASAFGFSRDRQDRYARKSLKRAMEAHQRGAFSSELVPLQSGTGEALDRDEQPMLAKPGRIGKLKPAFRSDGTVTAANSSSISDGAAAMLLAAESEATASGLPVLARIVGHATAAQKPSLFTTAPAAAVRILLDQIGWTVGDVDLWEVNEAFAVVALAFAETLDVPTELLNINGGACALGHPIGASGARILVTLIHAMEAAKAKRGVAAICIGGGEATAVALERP